MASVETDAQPRESALPPAMAFAIVGGFIGAGLLWWRFGEAVYASGLVTAFMACF
jgi:hypothetical protein